MIDRQDHGVSRQKGKADLMIFMFHGLSATLLSGERYIDKPHKAESEVAGWYFTFSPLV